MAFRADFLSVAVAEDGAAAQAAKAVGAIVAAGAALLIAEPWRVSRMIRGADKLSIEELAAEIARRRALPPPADFNRALALAQLARALEERAFASAWVARNGRSLPNDRPNEIAAPMASRSFAQKG